MPPVYVMIGGRSRRFGVDKATHLVDGEPWASHVGRRLTGGGEIVLVGPHAPPTAIEGVRFVHDSASAEGPLAGVAAAIEDRRQQLGAGLLVLASCDLVRPKAAWLAPLLAAHEGTPGLEVAAYAAADRWQPFPAVAHTRWGPTLSETLAGGGRSFQEALSQAAAHAVDWIADEHGPPQANTPEELARLLGTA